MDVCQAGHLLGAGIGLVEIELVGFLITAFRPGNSIDRSRTLGDLFFHPASIGFTPNLEVYQVMLTKMHIHGNTQADDQHPQSHKP